MNTISVKISEKKMMFSNRDLAKLLLPLMLEQLLTMLAEKGEKETYNYIKNVFLKNKE